MRKLCIILSILNLFNFFYLSNGYKEEKLIVETVKGKVRGFKEVSSDGMEIYSYLGIPYAKPPIGPLRFKSPVEPDNWEGILEATHHPNLCLQHSFAGLIEKTDPSGTEDCLFLNVFTTNPQAKGKAVMVFIHGGGFFSGSAKSFLPYFLLNEEIILVVIQYRLGVLGFLSTEDEILPGNYGLKDQSMALRWIQQNIENFGGDVSKVTIFGNSAGGASVHLHMLSPWSKGYFKRAIAQSGTGLCSWAIRGNHRKAAQEIGRLTGCALGDNSHAFAKCLQEVDGVKLVNSTLNLVKWLCLPLDFVPRIDGDFIPDEPALLIRDGNYNKVDLIIGATRDEGAFLVYLMSLDEMNYRLLRDEFDVSAPLSLTLDNEKHAKEIALKAYERYTRGKVINEGINHELVKLFSDAAFIYRINVTCLLHSNDPDMKVYAYRLNYRGQFSYGDAFDVQGANDWISHIDELFYLFQGGEKFSKPLEDPDDLKVKRIMTQMWRNFAINGNPTPDDELGFKWETSRAPHYKHLKISTEPDNENFAQKDFQNLKFWLALPTHQKSFLPDVLSREKLEL